VKSPGTKCPDKSVMENNRTFVEISREKLYEIPIHGLTYRKSREMAHHAHFQD
jgi:hypothetical protein